MDRREAARRGQVQIASGLNVAAGIWLIVAPFVLGYSGTARALWNDIILGVIVLALAFWSATASSRTA